MKLWHKILLIVIPAALLCFGVYWFYIKPKPQPKVNMNVPAPDSVPDYEGSTFADGSSIKNGYYLDPTGVPVGVVKAGGLIYSIDGANVFLGSVEGNGEGLPAGGYVALYGVYPPTSIINQFKTGFGFVPVGPLTSK